MSWSSAVSVAIVVTCAAFFFEAVGFAIPFWISTTYTFTGSNNEETTFSTYASIWYVITCIPREVSSCASRAIDIRFEGTVSLSNFEGSTAEIIAEAAATVLGGLTTWNILQIVSSVGVGLCGLTMLFLICCRCAGIHSRGWFVTSLLFLILGDLIVIGITIIAAISYGTTFSFAKDPVTVETFPWSLLLFGIGGFLGIIAIMLLFVITCAWQKYGAYDEKERFSFDDMSTSDKRHNTQRHDGYDNPQYPEPHDPRKSYFEWYNGRHYNNSRESGMYRDFVDDYKNSSKNNLGAGYSNGGYGSDYNRDYRPDIRDTRNYRYYFPGRYDADYYMYRPHSQTRY